METLRNFAAAVEPPCRLARWILDRALLWFCIAMLVAIAVIIVVAVFSRTLGSSLAWYDEVTSNLLAWLTFYGSGLAVLRGSHLDFQGLVKKLPPAWQLAAMAAAKTVTIAFFAVMAYAGVVILELMEGETFISLEWIPMPLAESALPIGAAVFILAELATIPGSILALAEGADRAAAAR